MVADYGNLRLWDQHGPVGKQAIRRHFQRDATSWNTVRRGLLAAQAQPAMQATQPAMQAAQFVVQAAQPTAQAAQPAMQAAQFAVQTCAICFEPCIDASMVLECGHQYHGVCVARWFRKSPTCPTYRALPP
jgi:hypothetical protein